MPQDNTAPEPAPTASSPETTEPCSTNWRLLALVSGLLGCTIIGGVLAVVFGILAIIRPQYGRNKVCTCLIAMVGMLLGVGLAIPMIHVLHQSQMRAESIVNYRLTARIMTGVSRVVANNKDCFPAKQGWGDAVFAEIAVTNPELQNPPTTRAHINGYGLNEEIEGRARASVAPTTVVIFEIQVPGTNVVGGASLLRNPHSKRDRVGVGFADGHVETVATDRLASLRWNP